MKAGYRTFCFKIGLGCWAVSIFWLGCSVRNRFPDVPPNQRIGTAEQLLAEITKRASPITSLMASGISIARKGQQRYKEFVRIVAKRPASLRFESVSFFEQPHAILVTDAMDFSLWDMKNGRFVEGKATPANLSRLLPLPLDGPDVVRMVFGEPPAFPYTYSELAWDGDQNAYVLTLFNSTQEQRVWVHPLLLRATKIICRTQGKTSYVLKFENFLQEDLSALPQTVEIEIPAENIQLTIKLRSIKTNQPVDARAFKLLPPEGLTIEQLD